MQLLRVSFALLWLTLFLTCANQAQNAGQGPHLFPSSCPYLNTNMENPRGVCKQSEHCNVNHSFLHLRPMFVQSPLCFTNTSSFAFPNFAGSSATSGCNSFSPSYHHMLEDCSCSCSWPCNLRGPNSRSPRSTSRSTLSFYALLLVILMRPSAETTENLLPRHFARGGFGPSLKTSLSTSCCD